MRNPCSEKNGVRKGTWTPEEDQKLVDYVTWYGHLNWRQLPKFEGLARCGKSCRLRWLNYLRPNLKRGNYTLEEEETIINLHQLLSSRCSAIAAQMPGRTDNEIKNYWHTNLKKRLQHNSVVKAHEVSNSKDHSPVETVNNINGPSQGLHSTQLSNSCPFSHHYSSSLTESSTSTEYTTIVSEENLDVEDVLAFLNVDAYPMSGERLQHNSVAKAHEVSNSKDHSPVETAKKINGRSQGLHSTQLSNSCPFSHHFSSSSTESSTSTEYTAVISEENLDMEDVFAFLNADAYPMSGERLQHNSDTKAHEVSNSKDHSLVETANNINGPSQRLHCTQLSNSCAFSHHYSSSSIESSTSREHTAVISEENLDMEDEFAFLNADTYPMSGDFWLEPYMVDYSYVPSELDDFSAIFDVELWRHDK